jgi:hypothetical protein
MKKNNLTFLTILSFFILTSCGDKTPSTPTVNTAGILTVSTVTSSTDKLNPSDGLNTAFGPNNYTAIWVEDSKGKFIKTLYVTTAGAKKPSRRTWLTEWTLKTTSNTVDAKTGATAEAYGLLAGTWDGKDVNGILVADGTYTLRMELADDEDVINNGIGSTGVSSKFSQTFTKGTTAISITAPNVTSFSNNIILWTPTIQ